jgi:hypothetical protein
LQNARIITLLSLVTALVIAIPMGYFVNSSQAQLLPSAPSPPAKAPTIPKAVPAVTPVKAPTHVFKVDVILFGVDNKTGNVVTFVTAKNQTAAVAVNATDENIKHENSTGVAEVFFTLPNLKLKVGDKFQACNILIKDSNLVCGTGLKSPLNKTESINLLVTGPTTSGSNKSQG